MPLRSAETRELCQAIVPAGNALEACKARTEDGCPRCGRPLCARHMPATDTRCRDCEESFAARLRAHVGRYVVVAAFVLGVVGATMVAVALLVGSVVAVLPVAAVAATGVVFLMSPVVFDRVFARAIPRRTFLKERKRSLPAPRRRAGR